MNRIARRTLFGAGGVLGAGLLLAFSPARRVVCGTPEEAYRRLAHAAIGRACVACDARLTRDHVAGWLADADPADHAARVSADFAGDATVEVDGWLLARTEAYGYAASYYGLG